MGYITGRDYATTIVIERYQYAILLLQTVDYCGEMPTWGGNFLELE